MLIRSAQLIKAPSIEVCRELAIAEPVERKVKPTLRVAFGGHEFDVSSVPGLLVGQKVLVTRNPWRSDAAQVVMTGEDGHEVFYVVPKVEVNEFGFAQDTRGTAVIGERFARHADTPAQEARKVIEQVMTETDSVKDAEEARKRQALPLGGKLDPYKHIHDTELPSYLPRRGTEHELRTPVIETPPISTYALAKRAQAEISDWSPEHYDWLCAHYPDGAKEDDFEAVLDAVRAAFDRRPMLSVVGGA